MPEPFDPTGEPRSFGLRVDRQGGIDEDHPRRPGQQATTTAMSQHAAEWGLASLLTGGFVLICTAVIVLFDLLFWNTGEQVVAAAAPWAMKLVVVGAVVAALVMIALAAAGLAFGVRALHSSLQRRQPAGLALAGTVVSAAALVLFTLTAVGGLMVILTFTG